MSDVSTVVGATTQGVLDKSEAAKNKLAKDLDSFLLLLTSQLKAQDPLNPMDSTEFTGQLVQFAQVEQQIGMNENLTNLIGLSQQSIASSAVNYIGKIVEGVSKQVPMQNGALRAAYGLEDTAQSANIVIRDTDGVIVHTAPAETTQGVHEFNWNGIDAQGTQHPDGTYTLEVSALAGDGTPVNSYVTAFGRVTGVTTIEDKTVLLLDKVGVSIDNVLSVSETEEEDEPVI
ncbi:MAG: flagellar hook capping FlgD N-terminal domain-containing protein [Rhodospirillaceae bacterium]